MERKRTKCYVVTGFYEAGKTTYIQENIFRDFFHKRGDTLILSFEDGEIEYDTVRLADYRTYVELYEGEEEISVFCWRMLEKYHPDRVFIEANIMRENLINQLPEELQICDTTVLIDGATFPFYFSNMRQLVQSMITSANMVLFHRCESKNSLKEFATPLRLMNSNCLYLWESPMGYAEQAFGLNLPYSLDSDKIDISEDVYPIWFLDVSKSPEHYIGKILEFHVQVKLRDDLPEDHFMVGKLLMPCCPADMQFCGVECINNSNQRISDGDWIHLLAKGIEKDSIYGEKQLLLQPITMNHIDVNETILSLTA